VTGKKNGSIPVGSNLTIRREAIDEVIDSGYLVVHGSHVENFEIEVSRSLELDYVIRVANGNHGIELAIRSSIRDKRSRILTERRSTGVVDQKPNRTGQEIVNFVGICDPRCN
jgi:hypothetical protein